MWNPGLTLRQLLYSLTGFNSNMKGWSEAEGEAFLSRAALYTRFQCVSLLRVGGYGSYHYINLAVTGPTGSPLLPVHPGQVAPEVSGSVSSRHFDGINHHWVTLWGESRAAAGSPGQNAGSTGDMAVPDCGGGMTPARQGTDHPSWSEGPSLCLSVNGAEKDQIRLAALRGGIPLACQIITEALGMGGEGSSKLKSSKMSVVLVMEMQCWQNLPSVTDWPTFTGMRNGPTSPRTSLAEQRL